MIISGFDKLSILNYPGEVACTIFTNGCNFKCPYCQNSGLVLGTDHTRYEEDQILAYLKKRKGLIDGICISGGEPTIQKGLKEFIQKVKGLKVKVKLDTNGSHPEVLEDLLKENLLDYVAMDIKTSLKKYEEVTNAKAPLSKIKKSIQLLQESSIAHEFRTTVIKQYHTIKDIEEIAELTNGSPYYLQKYVDSDTCIKQGLASYTDQELIQIYQQVLQKYPNIKLRGIDIESKRSE